jgi:hypothetical protein
MDEEGRATTERGGYPLLPTGVGGGVGGWSGYTLARNVPDRESLAVDRMTPYDRGAPDPPSRGDSRQQEWDSSVGEDTHSTPLHLQRQMWCGGVETERRGHLQKPCRRRVRSLEVEGGGVGGSPLLVLPLQHVCFGVYRSPSLR